MEAPIAKSSSPHIPLCDFFFFFFCCDCYWHCSKCIALHLITRPNVLQLRNTKTHWQARPCFCPPKLHQLFSSKYSTHATCLLNILICFRIQVTVGFVRVFIALRHWIWLFLYANEYPMKLCQSLTDNSYFSYPTHAISLL